MQTALKLVNRGAYGPVGSDQVVVHRGYAYVAPMKDAGATVIDVRLIYLVDRLEGVLDILEYTGP